jgi:hypothetical protein
VQALVAADDFLRATETGIRRSGRRAFVSSVATGKRTFDLCSVLTDETDFEVLSPPDNGD